MTFERGILTAIHHSEYPEAVERTLNDPAVVLLHTPDMVSELVAEKIGNLSKLPTNSQLGKFTGREMLMSEVPVLSEVGEVIAGWVHKQANLRRFKAVTGPEFHVVKPGSMHPHTDGHFFRSKRGPMAISVGIEGEAIFSGDRPGKDLMNNLGFESITKWLRLRRMVDEYQEDHDVNKTTFDLPATVLQKKADGIWIPNFPNPTIHGVRVPSGEPGERVIQRSAAILDYRMWHNPNRVPPVLALLVLSRAA